MCLSLLAGCEFCLNCDNRFLHVTSLKTESYHWFVVHLDILPLILLVVFLQILVCFLNIH